MGKSDNLKLTILVDNNPVYFGAPVFYSKTNDREGEILNIQTEIGTQVKQKILIQLKNLTYVEVIVKESTESISE
jgi:hypothetical protein